MEQNLFYEWIGRVVSPYKQTVNPDDKSRLIVDNHGSWFSTKSIDLCTGNNIEMLSYPGHLTQILQGPDVLLNKPISTTVNAMVHNNPLISGNCELSRVSFIAIIDHAVRITCTCKNVIEAFRAMGIIPFNPDQIDLNDYPSSTAPDLQNESPVTIPCSECIGKNIELHPLVRQKNACCSNHLHSTS